MTGETGEQPRVVPVKEVARRIAELVEQKGLSTEEACWEFVNETPDNPIKRLIRGTWDFHGRDLIQTWYHDGLKQAVDESGNGPQG